MKKIAVTSQGVEQIMREAIGIGEKYSGMKRAMEWWRSRCREETSTVNDACNTSRNQAAIFTAMKHRAESAESSLAAMRQRAEEAEKELKDTLSRHVDLFNSLKVSWDKKGSRVLSAEYEVIKQRNRAERAEACLRRVQRLADDGVDDPAGPHNVLAQIANTVEAVLSSPPADTSKTGGEREHSYGYCPACGAPGIMREKRPNGDDKCANGHTYPSKDAVMEKKS